MSVLFLLLLIAASPIQHRAPAASTPSRENPPDIRHIQDVNPQDKQARSTLMIGLNDLHLGRLTEAQSNCDAALKLDPSWEIAKYAKECLAQVSQRIVDQDLNDAAGKLLAGDRQGAIAQASKWAYAAPLASQRKRASQIVESAYFITFGDFWKAITPEWIRQGFAVIFDLSMMALLLLLARKIWRRFKGPQVRWKAKPTDSAILRKLHQEINRTNWTMLPLKELPAPADGQTGVPTDAVLDALSRLGHELKRPLWQPKLLLLRPTPPANYEPALISEFCSNDLNFIVLAPGASDLSLEWKMHDVHLSQAVQSLQFKTAAGIDIGSVARFLGSILEWFNAGSPTICGLAETNADHGFTLHLTARGRTTARGETGESITVSATTAAAPGIDPIQLSAERVAFKFLLRLRYPEMTDDEMDGFSALRQGAFQFVQYAGTIPGAGNDASARKSSLSDAAKNFGIFRASIPLHCAPSFEHDHIQSIEITDGIRQAVLLAEGVARALAGEDQDRMPAIDCFRQLQDWPGSPETATLRQQASYNEAVMWGQIHSYGRSVLMLTDLLGERAPDTLAPSTEVTPAAPNQKPPLPDAIRFPARVARLSAFARYTRDDWSTLPRSRVKLLIDDAIALVSDLEALKKQDDISAHDQRVVEYMYIESLRGIGHVQLLSVITGEAADLYRDNRPTGLKDASISDDGKAALQKGISWMLACEQRAPGYDLYCDLSEAYLLLKDFPAAEGYARHATLQSNTDYERAYYLATESFYLQNTAESALLAIKYATDYMAKSKITLDEFKSVCRDLDIRDSRPTGLIPKPPP
jgi:hypothetical protein